MAQAEGQRLLPDRTARHPSRATSATTRNFTAIQTPAMMLEKWAAEGGRKMDK